MGDHHITSELLRPQTFIRVGACLLVRVPLGTDCDYDHALGLDMAVALDIALAMAMAMA